MKQRLTALALAGLMVLSLAACGGKDAEDPSPAPGDLTSEAPVESQAPSESEVPESAAVDSEAPAPNESAQPSGETVGETTAPPAEPTPEAAKDPTAAGLRELFMLSSSRSDAPTADFSDMSGYLESFYNLSADDLHDFVFYMPDMSTALQEFFLAKAKPGKVEDVKAACQSRLEGLREEAEFYPGTAEFVDAAQVETVGDWVVLAVCPEASRMVKILQDATK